MAKLKDPVRFSDVYRVDPQLLADQSAFNPILNADTPLFIDPLLLDQSRAPEMRQAHVRWIQHFENVITVLHRVQTLGDLAWRAAERLFDFPEVPGTCLGYGSGIRGSGIGRDLRSRLLTTARRIVELGVEDPRLFVLLPLIEDDIGPDRISDMTTRIIGPQLVAFTHRVLERARVPMEEFRIGRDRFLLPRNPTEEIDTPVILVPTDVLRDLPIASDWADVASAAAGNEEIRDQVNQRIGDIWVAKHRREKQELRARVMASRDAVDTLINVIADAEKRSYDLDIDPNGVNRWLEDSKAFANAFPLAMVAPARHTLADLRAVVEAIINQFRALVEQNGLWKLLYVDGDHRPEKYAQLLFFGIAKAYCEANDIDVSPESNAGGGPVDFKFSRGSREKIVVEVKLSTNTRIRHGYEKQLEVYKSAEGTQNGYFLILNIGGGERQVERVQELEERARQSGDQFSRVEIVDATPKVAASRR